jgi:tRNA threonylcarbamoyladenosine biosynthesis protein TsaE
MRGKVNCLMPIVIPHMLDVISHSTEQTQRFGMRLANLLGPGDVLALVGELGSGKTVFVQGLARGLGVHEPVHSPSFILANEYRTGSLPIYHVDAYRIRSAAEALGFGLDDYLGDSGVTVIEWADRILDVLPDQYLRVEFRHVSNTKRGILMKAIGDRYERLVQELKQNAFGL